MRFIPPAVALLAVLALTGCASTVAGTARPVDVGSTGASSTTTTTAAPAPSSSYANSLLSTADFPAGTDYAPVAATVENILPSISASFAGLTTNPPGCFLTPGISQQSTAAQGAAVAAFMRPGGGGTVVQIVTSAASVPEDALLQQVSGCGSFIASDSGGSLSGTYVTTSFAESDTGLTATLISRILTTPSSTTVQDTIVGYDRGAMTAITFDRPRGATMDTALVTALTSAAFVKLKGA